jgi:hypothetical protein
VSIGVPPTKISRPPETHLGLLRYPDGKFNAVKSSKSEQQIKEESEQQIKEECHEDSFGGGASHRDCGPVHGEGRR